MARKSKAEAPIEESIRLSSAVTIIVKAAADVYDSLDIQRAGGVVTVALPGASGVAQARVAPPVGDGRYVPPATAQTDLTSAAAALAAQFPNGSVSVVSPTSLGFPSLTPEMLGEGGTSFAGRSNEDTDA